MVDFRGSSIRKWDPQARAASGRIIIPGEDPADFEALLDGLTAEHAPATETEQILVRQMAQSWWLMQRAIRFQNEAFAEMQVDAHRLAPFLLYQTTHERAFYKALNTLLKLRAERRKSDREFVSQNAALSAGASSSADVRFIDPPLADLQVA